MAMALEEQREERYQPRWSRTEKGTLLKMQGMKLMWRGNSELLADNQRGDSIK
jgi:hypothetical protein